MNQQELHPMTRAVADPDVFCVQPIGYAIAPMIRAVADPAYGFGYNFNHDVQLIPDHLARVNFRARPVELIPDHLARVNPQVTLQIDKLFGPSCHA